MATIAETASEAQRPRKLRLVVVRPTLSTGGADRITVTLLRNLDRELFDISLVLMRPEGEILGEVPSDVRLQSLEASSLWRAWWPLARLIGAESPDVVLSTSSGMNVAAAVAHRLCRSASRLVLSERGLLRRDYGPRKRLLAAAKRASYGRADAVIAVSREVARELREELRVPEGKIELIPNPVVDDELTDLAAAPVEHPWFVNSTPILLAAGRLVPEKDFSTLIRAFALVRSRRPARLVLLGDGPLRDTLERQVAEASLETDVHFAGFEANPFRYMSKCAVFVLSSTSEGLPGVLVQAMACGAAVVATDCPSGPREVIEPGRTGVLVPVGDPAAMAAEIAALLADPEHRSHLGSLARKAASRFSVEENLPRYQSALLGVPAVDGPSAVTLGEPG